MDKYLCRTLCLYTWAHRLNILWYLRFIIVTCITTVNASHKDCRYLCLRDGVWKTHSSDENDTSTIIVGIDFKTAGSSCIVSIFRNRSSRKEPNRYYDTISRRMEYTGRRIRYRMVGTLIFFPNNSVDDIEVVGKQMKPGSPFRIESNVREL